MQTFKQLCNNDPAVAIKALIDGLLHQERIPWLELDFNYFAEASILGSCCGCAATFTVLNLANSQEAIETIDSDTFIDEYAMAAKFGWDTEDCCKFELAIDAFRAGDPIKLGEYFNVILPIPSEHWFLSNVNGLKDLDKIVAYHRQILVDRQS